MKPASCLVAVCVLRSAMVSSPDVAAVAARCPRNGCHSCRLLWNDFSSWADLQSRVQFRLQQAPTALMCPMMDAGVTATPFSTNPCSSVCCHRRLQCTSNLCLHGCAICALLLLLMVPLQDWQLRLLAGHADNSDMSATS